jgi:hypothetical protein
MLPQKRQRCREIAKRPGLLYQMLNMCISTSAPHCLTQWASRLCLLGSGLHHHYEAYLPFL